MIFLLGAGVYVELVVEKRRLTKREDSNASQECKNIV